MMVLTGPPLLQLLPCFGLLLLSSVVTCVDGTTQDFLETLAQRIQNEQMTEDAPFTGLGKPFRLEGNYVQNLRVNTRGRCEMSVMRRDGKAPYMSAFTGGFVATMLLDAVQYAHAPRPSRLAMERISKLYAKFHLNDGSNSSIIRFLLYAYDEKHEVWYEQSSDFSSLLLDETTRDELDLNGPGLMRLFYGSSLTPDLATMLSPKAITERHLTPADFDTTFLNLFYGAKLHQHADAFPDAYQIWSADNTNFTSVFESLKKNAYRPFSEKEEENSIDTRTYYCVRDFLTQQKAKGQDVAIFTTFALTIKEQRITSETTREAMPRGVSIVGGAVVSNILSHTIGALTSGLLDPSVFLDDQDLSLVYTSSGDLLVHLLQNNFAGRPDLMNAYYSNTKQLYWFAARALLYVESYHSEYGPLPVPLFDDYFAKLSQVMRNEVTNRILGERSFGENGDVFFDDVLGNADVSFRGRPIQRHEDRVYTTSMSANSLLYTWTVHDPSNGGLHWLEVTPQEVKDTVYGCAQWLEANALTGEFKPDGIFFTSDVHGFETLPYWYPYNMFQFMNGSQAGETTNSFPPEVPIIGVSGYIDPDEYEELLKQDQFGFPTPREFRNFNDVQGSPVFWSCDAFVYSGVLLTVSMTRQVNDTDIALTI